MKRLLFIALLLPGMTQAQKIAENKVDEFTHHHVITTDWGAISKTNDFWAHARMSKIDSNSYLDLKFFRSGGQVLGISSGATVMLKLTNDSIVTLQNIDDKVSCRGCGSVGMNGAGVMGLSIRCTVSPDQSALLRKYKVAKIRISTLDGFLEYAFREKFRGVIQNELGLIN